MSRSNILVCSFVALAVLLSISTAVSFAGDSRGPATVDEFMKRYEADCKKVEQVYRRMACRWTYQGYASLQRPVAMEYLAWDDARKVAAAEGVPQHVGPPFYAAFWVGRQVVYVFGKPDSNERLLVPKPSEGSEIVAGMLCLFSEPVFLTHHQGWYSRENKTFFDFLAQRKDTVKLGGRAEIDGDFRIECQAAKSERGDVDSSMYLDFSPRSIWAPRRIEFISRGVHKAASLHRIGFEGEFNGVPLVKSVHLHQKSGEKPSEYGLTAQWDVSECRPLVSPPEPAEFQVTSVGATPAADQIPRSSWLWLLLAAIGLLLLAIGYAKMRKTKTSQ